MGKKIKDVKQLHADTFKKKDKMTEDNSLFVTAEVTKDLFAK